MNLATAPAERSLRERDVRTAVSDLLGAEVLSLTRIGSGANSRAYRATCAPEHSYAVKLYFRDQILQRNRLEAEYDGLGFLWRHGIRQIPRPIAADRARGIGIYEWLEGRPLLAGQVTATDIDAAAGFVGELRKLRNCDGSHLLPSASEACFSMDAIRQNVQDRLDRLAAIAEIGPEYDALHRFLDREFGPAMDEIWNWVVDRHAQAGANPEAELPRKARTLSPSDFGFHNALRRADGTIAWLDFEYFGWDDPAKTVADFLLHPHPAMNVSVDLKQRARTELLARLGVHSAAKTARLDWRLPAAYPLWGLKWCLIILNEFIPEHLSRRAFASRADVDGRVLRAKQLTIARDLLGRVKIEYGTFPQRA